MRVPDLITPYDMVPVDAPVPEDDGLPGPAPGDPVGDNGAGDLDAVRELVLRAHPDIVPELVTGGTIAELIASVESARAAYARLAQAFPGQRQSAAPVPAGGGGPIAVDPDRIPAAEKIRRGLAAAASFSKKG